MKTNSPFTTREFICGWLAASTNIIITYPLSKISIQQVLHNESLLKASKYNVVRRSSPRDMYRGLLPPLCQKSLSVSFMFGAYYNIHNYLITKNVKYANHLSIFALGIIETMIMPFERIQSILVNRDFNKKYKNMIQLMITLPQEYGFKECYRGMNMVLLRNILGTGFFFNLKNTSDFYISESYKLPVIQSAAQFVLGGIIGAFISTCLYPLSVIKLEMQKPIGTKFVSPIKVMVEIYSRKGKFMEFYKGGVINAVRAFFSWGIINTSYETYMKWFFE
ncbi:hypothetical protein WA026_017272 [Henosepilachna vigintioctopunctata]|uniref:Mitochondrial carrier protein n=1 Tax=Henosepilachna vigintioctopunctata TaxID=420089 RepID=A0AAW1ULT2_9CUCU